MDGGRVLRAALAFRLPYARATELAAMIRPFPLVVATLVTLAGHAWAAEPGPSKFIVSRLEAITIGATRGPGIAVAASPRSAARDARDAATALPRPATVSLVVGYRAAPTTSGAELGATATQDIALRGLGSARTRSADTLTQLIDADTARARLDAGARAAVAWVGALEAKEVLHLRTDALAQAEAILATTRARVDSGVGQPYELALAEGEMGVARAGLLDAEGAEVEAFAELRFALGLSAAEPVEAVDDLYATDERPIDEASALRSAETAHPLLGLARARAQLAEQEVRLTKATLGPSISVGASYLREATGDRIVTAIVGVPLPFIDASAFEAARQRAGYQVAVAQTELIRAQLARDIRQALHDREHWREVRDALRSKALAPMQEALRLARVQYDVGTHEITSVLVARQRLLSTEEALAHVAAQVQRADVQLGHASATLLKGVVRP